MQAQERMTTQPRRAFARQSLYKGDTILWIELRPVYIYKPLKFKNNRQQKSYSRLVRNVKKTLPIAKEIKGIIIQTSLNLDSIPTEKERKKYFQQFWPKKSRENQEEVVELSSSMLVNREDIPYELGLWTFDDVARKMTKKYRLFFEKRFNEAEISSSQQNEDVRVSVKEDDVKA